MPTNIVRVGPAASYGSAWSDVGEGINEGLSSVLGYYQEYTRQKRFEEQQKYDRQQKAAQMAQHAEEQKYLRENREDQRNAVRAAQAERDATMLSPEAALQMPEFTTTVEKSLAGPPALDETGQEIPLGTEQQKQLLPSKKFGEYNAIFDYGGRRALAAKEAEKQADWLPLAEDFMGITAGTKVPPAVWTLAGKPAVKPSFQHGPGGAIYRETPEGLKLEIAGKETVSASDKKAAKDAEQETIINSIAEGDIESVPKQYREVVRQMAEGRGVIPRGGTNVNFLMQMAAAYNPALDMQNVNARKALRADLAKGSTTSRGGQITSLNTLGSHLQSLQDASDELGKHFYGGQGMSSVNWAAQKALPSSARAPIARFAEKANAVREEYIRALKGASPTDTELKAFEALKDPTLAPAERQAHLDALRELAEGRANAQEATWEQTFGQSSVASGQPMFSGNWDYADGVWKLKRKGAAAAGSSASAPSANPFGLVKP